LSLEKDKLIADCKNTESELDLQLGKLESEEKRARENREVKESKLRLQLELDLTKL